MLIFFSDVTFIPTPTDSKTQKLVEAFKTLQKSMWNDQGSIVNSSLLRNIKVLAVINAVMHAFVGTASYRVVTESGSRRQDKCITVPGSKAVFCEHCTKHDELKSVYFGLILKG